jgi:predicted metalloprotease with PDZ domain
MALTAAQMETRAGRQWRSLEDTAVGAQMLHRASPEWQSWRRAADYYPEGVLLWLEVDATLRQRSGGAKSIDDFARAFFGGPNHGAEVKPYTIDDVVATLDGIVAYDWRGFFRARVDEVAPHAPLGGLTMAGWRLGYSDKPNERMRAIEKEDKTHNFSYSLGFTMKEDGQVVDVIPGSPAAKAGLAPAMRVIGVDGRKLTKERLPDALKLARGPIELLVLNADDYKVLKLDYRGGSRAPHLTREAGKPDLLPEIARPRQTSISPTR